MYVRTSASNDTLNDSSLKPFEYQAKIQFRFGGILPTNYISSYVDA